jgi:phosphonate transport system permease protein
MTAPPGPPTSTRPPWIAGLLSLVVPGLGQVYCRKAYRGATIFGSVLIALLISLWYGKTGWYLIPAAVWLWGIWDATGTAGGRPHSTLLPLAAMLVMGYGIGWEVTSIDPGALTRNLDRASSIIRPMLHPDFISQRQETNTAWVPIEVPCGPNPPPAVNDINGIHVQASPDCGNLRDVIILQATGLWPNTETEIQWATPIGDRLPLGEGFISPLRITTDSDGNLNAVIQVHPSALTQAPDPTLPLEHRVYLIQSRSVPGLQISANGGYVLQGIWETLFLALMATTIGAVGAIPVSFLAARNLMGSNVITLALYTLTRTVLNIVRSVEPLIIAIVFVVIVGLGPFAGVIAMTFHTIAALGKLYSEVIEGIDPGPIEAIRATGGNWAQMVRYAVIPQIIPPFTSFTMYRWDINVRTSTIIGFVGGGGIGFYLYQWIIKGDFRAVGASFVAIAIIVMILDFVSARIRARLV